MSYKSYHEILQTEFERRQHLNDSYSLRAYARDLGLSAPRLSQILSKTTGLSVENALKVSKKLKLTEEKAKWFCDSAGATSARSSKEKAAFAKKIAEYKREAKKFSEINLDYFKVIEDWFHFAILELTYLTDFQNDERWMARRLGITTPEVRGALERMKRLGLITEKNGTLVDTFKFLATPSDVPSEALRKFNSQLMKKAMESLPVQDVSVREVSSNIVSIKKAQIPEFKDRIREFRRDLERYASETTDKDAVYCLGVQFFELSRTSE